MNRLNLSNKLSLLLVLAVLLSTGILGLYFDTFLKDDYLQSTKKRMNHGYHRLAADIVKIENELSQGISFIETDENILASIDLINNYQDKESYHAVLLDEEKKNIVRQLLSKVKLSLNDDISLYDKHQELIAFVVKKNNTYHLNFVSYENGTKVLYSKCENDERYAKSPFKEHPFIQFQHISYYGTDDKVNNNIITYHLYENDIVIKSHHSIMDRSNENILAHIEMSHELGSTYLVALSDDLDMHITATQDEQYAPQAQPLLSDKGIDQIKIRHTREDYYGVASLETQDGHIYLVTTLNKALLNTALNDNRRKFLILLLFVAGAMLVILRFLLAKGLSRPLETLMVQIKKIEKGDYSRSTPVHTGDELETISKNVNNLATTIQERESALERSQENLAYLSHHDELTDLPNRRLFSLQLEHALNLANRKQTKLAVLFLDLDYFKHINDTLGHDVGDLLLKSVSLRLKESLRSADTLARIGGDEFNILIEEIDDIEEVNVIARKLLEDFKAPFFCSDEEINITVSIGIALYPTDGTNSVSLIKNADLALYRSKEKGRNRYSFYSKKFSDILETRTMQINAMRSAIERGDEFTLLYQPKISLLNEEVTAVEALIRWNSPELGLIPTDQFIKLAEETELIIPVGQWVLQQACLDFMAMQEQGCRLDHISINISNIQLKDASIIETLQEVVSATGILPHQIELEITESYIASNKRKVMETLHGIREMGLRMAIDDFGTGYSSMSYLQKLPVTRLKIDKSFVDGLPGSAENLAITKAIIALAKTFGLKITAEGVETEAQMKLLKKEQCDEAQGYYYAKPLSIEAFTAYYRSRK